MDRSDLFLRACAGEVTESKPVWVMRQAGRYLPEYMKVRNSFPSFTDFYKNPEACAEVTWQPIERFGFDAAIMFSDILTLLEPMGVDLEFVKGKGPVISNPVRTLDDMERITSVDVEKDLDFVGGAVKAIKKRLDGRVPLMGFAGGPLTVGSYIIEGGSSKDLSLTKKMAFSRDPIYKLLMDQLAATTVEYLKFQIASGVDAVVVMDSWAGHFSREEYREFVFPYTQKIIAEIQLSESVPVIHYANGASNLYPVMQDLGADVLGVDWRVSLNEIIAECPDMTYQGNLDPCMLYAPNAEIERRTREILEIVKDRPHIMNLGHGVTPTMPISGVETFVKTIQGR
ncbi:MAG: uroporphyrinogen decarboxylase [Fibrobacterales bacterium]